jgi:hypothetical protein
MDFCWRQTILGCAGLPPFCRKPSITPTGGDMTQWATRLVRYPGNRAANDVWPAFPLRRERAALAMSAVGLILASLKAKKPEAR